MPLPTTGRTVHFSALANTNLWQHYQVGSPFHNTQVSANNDPIGAWAEESAADLSLLPTNDFNRPFWQSATGFALFDGTSDVLDLWNAAGTVTQPVNTIITASAYTVLMAIYVVDVTNNAANAYSNPGILGDGGGYFGLHVRDASGQAKLQLYNWDGNEDVVEKDITRNTVYVVMCRHESSNLYISLNGGSESSIASGDTSVLTNVLKIGLGGTAFANCGLGEFAIYNVALTGTDLTDAISYFTGRWLAGGALSIPVAMHYYRMMRGA